MEALSFGVDDDGASEALQVRAGITVAAAAPARRLPVGDIRYRTAWAVLPVCCARITGIAACAGRAGKVSITARRGLAAGTRPYSRITHVAAISTHSPNATTADSSSRAPPIIEATRTKAVVRQRY